MRQLKWNDKTSKHLKLSNYEIKTDVVVKTQILLRVKIGWCAIFYLLFLLSNILLPSDYVYLPANFLLSSKLQTVLLPIYNSN